MENRIKVGILFGGKSAEHEVSIQSAKNVYDAIDKNKYQVTMIGISKRGQWFLDHYFEKGCVPAPVENADGGENLALVLGTGENQLLEVAGKNLIGALDVVFPVLHGPFGEDGTVQGLLKQANIPFVGADVLGSAVGMDKDVMKRLLRDSDLPIAPYVLLHKYADAEMPNPTYQEIAAYLCVPFFVKPANLGSSVGISKVQDEGEFDQAVAEAFQYDHKLIVEKNIVGREMEISILGNENPMASLPGEIISQHSFYSYEAKYLDEHGAILKIPASLPDHLVAKIQQTALKTFKALCCEGMARVDFFLTEKDEIIINEINTIPGFTKISMYPKLWDASGISYTELIDRLIQLALARFNRDRQLKTSR
ncbi:D-alanine--D-alanine ligase [Candidatus Formimonas warabiya]|uniref:D-alanine--D-alanine ligase n=1 Tax=Formimonas warabiya TaxID=1761012 RepID=A0A3G1KQ41_FORW1|nr:D-alanine--D-alanine ligase [Candidatus Formimonas warabiya]ATW24550.1 D-alanine--D-alanine ligase A [Candidatus Formimonas warabiya]